MDSRGKSQGDQKQANNSPRGASFVNAQKAAVCTRRETTTAAAAAGRLLGVPPKAPVPNSQAFTKRSYHLPKQQRPKCPPPHPFSAALCPEKTDSDGWLWHCRVSSVLLLGPSACLAFLYGSVINHSVSPPSPTCSSDELSCLSRQPFLPYHWWPGDSVSEHANQCKINRLGSCNLGL